MRSQFKFKQFSVNQSEKVAKLSTDSVLLGSSLVLPNSCKRILDIGTGTGVISLMIAQRYKTVSIYGLDIDSSSAELCMENFAQSPWSDRLISIKADINKYVCSEKFDQIICNPPYFFNSLLPKTESRQRIRHSTFLSYEQLIQSVDRLLKPNGKFTFIIPNSSAKILVDIGIKFSFNIIKIINFRDQKDKPIIRKVITFSKHNVTRVEENDHYIYDNERKFSKKVSELLFEYLIIFK